MLAFIALVLYKLLVRMPQSRGLLSSDTSGNPEPERVTSLIAAAVSIGGYALQCTRSDPIDLNSMPNPDEWILWTGLAGQMPYLSGKFIRTYWIGRSND